jgi:hypothetical protein
LHHPQNQNLIKNVSQKVFEQRLQAENRKLFPPPGEDQQEMSKARLLSSLFIRSGAECLSRRDCFDSSSLPFPSMICTIDFSFFAHIATRSLIQITASQFLSRSASPKKVIHETKDAAEEITRLAILHHELLEMSTHNRRLNRSAPETIGSGRSLANHE